MPCAEGHHVQIYEVYYSISGNKEDKAIIHKRNQKTDFKLAKIEDSSYPLF